MTWITYTCEISNRPAMVLVDNRFAGRTRATQLQYVSWFGVYCNQPTGNGFWDPAETEILDRIEDDLIDLTSKFGHGWVVYLLRIATWGIREYYLYHSDDAEMDKAFCALKALYPEYRIEKDRLEDPDWTVYGKYI